MISLSDKLACQGAVRNLRTRGRGIPVNAGSQQGGGGRTNQPGPAQNPPSRGPIDLMSSANARLH